MTDEVTPQVSCAAFIAKALKTRGLTRVFALCGGHVMPIWMALDDEGIEIVEVRDERSAVLMAYAHAAVAGGLGVALVTAGPRVTNAINGIANAHVSRVLVMILSGVPPRPGKIAAHCRTYYIRRLLARSQGTSGQCAMDRVCHANWTQPPQRLQGVPWLCCADRLMAEVPLFPDRLIPRLP